MIKNILSLLVLVTILSSCATTKEKPTTILGETKLSQVTDPQSATSGAVTVPTLTGTVTVSETQPNFTFKCKNCTEEESNVIAAAQKKIARVIWTQCFADHFILPKYRSQLIQTNGLTRQQVVDKIRQSFIKNIPLEMYYKRNGVVGYTTPSTDTIYLNRYFRTKWDYDNGYWSVDAEASNLLHEATHKAPMSFDHDYKSTSRRPYSVPYTANYAYESCANQ